MPPSKTLDDQLTFPLTASDKDDLRKLAQRSQRTLAALMRVIVREYLDKPDVRVKLQASHAEDHATRLEPAIEG